MLTSIFSALFPTRVTNFGHSLFFVTWETDYQARKLRLGRPFWKA